MTYSTREKDKDERKQTILQIIAEQPTIHHNAIKKVIVDEKKLMAKKTFEKMIKELRDRGTIVLVPMDDNKKHYVLSFDKTPFDKDKFEINLKAFLKIIKNEHMLFKKKYSKLNPLEKATVLSSKLSLVFQLQVGITFMNIVDDPTKPQFKKSELELQKWGKQLIDIMGKDKDANKVFPFIRDAILDNYKLSSLEQLPFQKHKEQLMESTK